MSDRKISLKERFSLKQFRRRLSRSIVRQLGGATREEVQEMREHLEQIKKYEQPGNAPKRQLIDDFLQRTDLMQEHVLRHSSALKWLGTPRDAASQVADTKQHETLVSVILPVYNRSHVLQRAIESVLQQSHTQWELIVVDDGSTDSPGHLLQAYAHDSRIRVITGAHAGVCRARNVALQAARGEVIAYLDSDNTWQPDYLAAVVQTFADDPQLLTAYAAQLVENPEQQLSYIRGIEFDRQRYLQEGGIDLNVFAHRRSAYEQYGGFDENLTRLVDWDLIARYTVDQSPAVVPIVGGWYLEHGADSVSALESFHYNRFLLQRKHAQPIERKLKVLYAIADYPQLTESYVRWEIDCMRRWGVEVEIWTELHNTTAPFDPQVTVHTGSLTEAVLAVKPDLVHFHWIHFALRYRDEVARYGLPMTVRGHGFDFNVEVAKQLQDSAGIHGVYLFPHFASQFHLKAVQSIHSAFNSELYYPEPNKDRRLVVRVSSGKPTKGLDDFVQIAKLCPDHRFVLAIGKNNALPEYIEEFLQYNREHGSPVEVHVNLPSEECAELMRKAGIYLHTYGHDEPFGMPISIAEGMATGAYTLVRNLPGAAEYVGKVGTLYESVEQAAQSIRATQSWFAETWNECQQQTIDHAYQQHLDTQVLRPLLNQWLEVTEHQHTERLLATAAQQELQPTIEFLIESLNAGQTESHGRSLLHHYLATYAKLQNWGASRSACLAGLVHSVYRLNRIPPDAVHRRHLRQLVGERAERLAFAFCANYREAFDTAILRGDAVLDYRDPQTDITFSEEDTTDLCRIHLAEYMEKRRGPATGWPAVFGKLAQRLGFVEQQALEAACSKKPANNSFSSERRAAA